MSKILTLAATGLAGLVLGAGLGVAGAGEATSPTRQPITDTASMDEMHGAMRDQMPAELVEQCDEMHVAMGDMDHGSMMGTMNVNMGGNRAGGHAAHHRDGER